MKLNNKSILSGFIVTAFVVSGAIAQAQDTTTTEEQPAQEQPAQEQPAQEQPAQEQPAQENTQEQSSDAGTADPGGFVTEEPIQEPDVTAEEVTPEVENEPAGTEPESGVEAEEAPLPEAAVESPAEEEEHAGEAMAEDHEGDSHATPHIENIDFSFDGPFGTYDVNQLQRGLQIYTEVCSACHGLKYVALRTLGDAGGPSLPEDQVIEYSKQFDVYDADLDDTRAATPVDHFPGSNLENAPDLSLMAKKRAAFHGPYGLGINQFLKGTGGAEYIAALLTSYTGEEKEQAGTVFYENTAFPGGWIAMAPPIADEQVEFVDGHANDAHHLAEDVSAFLMWTAEPKLGDRKQAGFAGVLFLTLLSVLLYLTNKRIWAPIKHKED